MVEFGPVLTPSIPGTRVVGLRSASSGAGLLARLDELRARAACVALDRAADRARGLVLAEVRRTGQLPLGVHGRVYDAGTRAAERESGDYEALQAFFARHDARRSGRVAQPWQAAVPDAEGDELSDLPNRPRSRSSSPAATRTPPGGRRPGACGTTPCTPSGTWPRASRRSGPVSGSPPRPHPGCSRRPTPSSWSSPGSRACPSTPPTSSRPRLKP